jgi:hypothetical protein
MVKPQCKLTASGFQDLHGAEAVENNEAEARR